jgi:NLI interacting factor-like phosphatase
MRRIAFDLDETLGVPLIEGDAIVGFQARPGCLELLDRLRPRCTLCLWSVSSRRYVEKCLSYGLSAWFGETYTWDELPAAWEDVRRIGADLLVDDSPHHRETAAKHGLADRYLIVPAYGGPEDAADPLAWVRLVERACQTRRVRQC